MENFESYHKKTWIYSHPHSSISCRCNFHYRTLCIFIHPKFTTLESLSLLIFLKKFRSSKRGCAITIFFFLETHKKSVEANPRNGVIELSIKRNKEPTNKCAISFFFFSVILSFFSLLTRWQSLHPLKCSPYLCLPPRFLHYFWGRSEEAKERKFSTVKLFTSGFFWLLICLKLEHSLKEGEIKVIQKWGFKKERKGKLKLKTCKFIFVDGVPWSPPAVVSTPPLSIFFIFLPISLFRGKATRGDEMAVITFPFTLFISQDLLSYLKSVFAPLHLSPLQPGDIGMGWDH